jgi:hypothetical protein
MGKNNRSATFELELKNFLYQSKEEFSILDFDIFFIHHSGNYLVFYDLDLVYFEAARKMRSFEQHPSLSRRLSFFPTQYKSPMLLSILKDIPRTKIKIENLGKCEYGPLTRVFKKLPNGSKFEKIDDVWTFSRLGLESIKIEEEDIELFFDRIKKDFDNLI